MCQAVVRLMRCNFTAGESARLPIEREIPESDVDQVVEAQRISPKRRSVAASSGGGNLRLAKEVARALKRQQHQIVDRKARQGLQDFLASIQSRAGACAIRSAALHRPTHGCRCAIAAHRASGVRRRRPLHGVYAR